MSDKPDDGKSFSLTEKLSSKRSRARIPSDPSLSWQEQAYDRLKVLYGVSKELSTFESTVVTFPKILELCSTAFPFVTAVLIEKRGSRVASAMWHATNVPGQQVDLALDNAQHMFTFLTDCTTDAAAELRLLQMSSGALANVQARLKAKVSDPDHFIAIPLFVDRLGGFGILQVEGSAPLTEKDLEFVDALADLVAVSIDRYYRSLAEREKTNMSEATVANLESERGQRESFVSLLTHDLITPLSAAKISAQLIQRQPDISDTSQSLAARIVSNLGRADQMITDLLDANRLRSGAGLSFKIEKVNLTFLIGDTLKELSTIHGERFKFASDQKVEGFWDEKAIQRVIENLCNNAVKYGEPHSPVTISLTSLPDSVSLCVHNEGEPIKASDQTTLFQQFRRSQNALGSRKKGWGIGLTLVRGVVEGHGGTVKVESTATKGTSFVVSLPLDAREFIRSKGLQ